MAWFGTVSPLTWAFRWGLSVQSQWPKNRVFGANKSEGTGGVSSSSMLGPCSFLTTLFRDRPTLSIALDSFHLVVASVVSDKFVISTIFAIPKFSWNTVTDRRCKEPCHSLERRCKHSVVFYQPYLPDRHVPSFANCPGRPVRRSCFDAVASLCNVFTPSRPNTHLLVPCNHT